MKTTDGCYGNYFDSNYLDDYQPSEVDFAITMSDDSVKGGH